MDPDIERLESQIEENRKLLEENNHILRKLHRSVIWGRIFKIIYWVVIIGVAIGAFYFIQPYIESLRDTYRDFREPAAQVQQEDGVGLGSSRLQHVRDVIDAF